MRVWIDGEIVDGEAARVPVLDHGFLYGDGIFEGMRSFGGKVFRVDDHLDRLGYGARALDLDLELVGGKSGLGRIVEETLRDDGRPDSYIRLIVSRGVGPLGVDASTCGTPRVTCIVDGLSIFSEEARQHGIAMATVAERRPMGDALDPRIKSLNYLNNVMARMQARRQGADEGLVLNREGAVAEASVANVFVVKDGLLRTPPTTDGSLDGMTRRTVLELASELGMDARVERLGRIDLLSADEVFLTGTGAGIVRVREFDRQLIGGGEPGQVTGALTDAYARRVRA